MVKQIIDDLMHNKLVMINMFFGTWSFIEIVLFEMRTNFGKYVTSL